MWRAEARIPETPPRPSHSPAARLRRLAGVPSAPSPRRGVRVAPAERRLAAPLASVCSARGLAVDPVRRVDLEALGELLDDEAAGPLEVLAVASEPQAGLR